MSRQGFFDGDLRQTTCVRLIGIPSAGDPWLQDHVLDFGHQCAAAHAHRTTSLASQGGKRALSSELPVPQRSQVPVKGAVSDYGMPPPPLPPPRRIFQTIMLTSCQPVVVVDLRLEPPSDGVRHGARRLPFRPSHAVAVRYW